MSSYIRINKSIKDINPEEHKDNVVKAKEGMFASVLVKNNFIWKKYNEDKMSNAVNAYIYWNNISKDDRSHFKVDLKKVEEAIKVLNSNLKLVSRKYKLPANTKNIKIYYEKKQGKWFNGDTHFVDYLWDSVCNQVSNKHGDWRRIPFLLVDDIYVLRAMQNRKLYIQHNISTGDTDSNISVDSTILLNKKKIIKIVDVVNEAIDLTDGSCSFIKKISKLTNRKHKALEIVFF